MSPLEKIRAWANLLRNARQFLDAQGFLEVTTPCLVEAGAFEASIDPLQVRFSGGEAELHTSPEIQMKAILAETRTAVYQIAPCFRDDPPSPIHRREFTMLEFYSLSDLNSLQVLLCGLLDAVAQRKLVWQKVRVQDLFLKLGLDLATLSSPEHFAAQIRKQKLTSTDPDDTWGDLFFRVWVQCIEPKLQSQDPLLVEGYPVAVSPLSQSSSDGFFAERFEIYWHGMELANGCTELTDPYELADRWEEQNRQRAVRAARPHPYPTRLFEALEKGLPPCSGVAVGLERLFLCLARQQGHKGSELL